MKGKIGKEKIIPICHGNGRKGEYQYLVSTLFRSGSFIQIISLILTIS